MQQLQSQDEQSNIRRVIVLGAVGAGKSTVLNVVNEQAEKSVKKVFVPSNQLTSGMQKFECDISPLPTLGLVQLLNSPSLSNAKQPIDQWVQMYKRIIYKQQWKFDLVVCVIEYTQRPSSKEIILFALLNQAFALIKPENLVILINKAPDGTTTQDAKAFYDKCCENLKQQDCRLPILTDENFLVMTRKMDIQRQLSSDERRQAQYQLNQMLTVEIFQFFQSSLQKVQLAIKPRQADRNEIAESLLDEQSKQQMAVQHHYYCQYFSHFFWQIYCLNQKFVAYETKTYESYMQEDAEFQNLAMQQQQWYNGQNGEEYIKNAELMRALWNTVVAQIETAHLAEIERSTAEFNSQIPQSQN